MLEALRRISPILCKHEIDEIAKILISSVHAGITSKYLEYTDSNDISKVFQDRLFADTTTALEKIRSLKHPDSRRHAANITFGKNLRR
jgi:hypothetical protein